MDRAIRYRPSLSRYAGPRCSAFHTRGLGSGVFDPAEFVLTGRPIPARHKLRLPDPGVGLTGKRSGIPENDMALFSLKGKMELVKLLFLPLIALIALIALIITDFTERIGFSLTDIEFPFR